MVLESRQGRREVGVEQSQRASPRELAQPLGRQRDHPSPLPLERQTKKAGQGKTDLEGRNLHTVTKADGT